VGHFLNIIAKYLNGLRKSSDSEDKKAEGDKPAAEKNKK